MLVGINFFLKEILLKIKASSQVQLPSECLGGILPINASFSSWLFSEGIQKQCSMLAKSESYGTSQKKCCKLYEHERYIKLTSASGRNYIYYSSGEMKRPVG